MAKARNLQKSVENNPDQTTRDSANSGNNPDQISRDSLPGSGPGSPDPPRPDQIPSHKPGCVCRLCQIVRRNREQGIPTKKERDQAARDRHQARLAERERKKVAAQAARAKVIGKEAARALTVETAIATQAQLGLKPDPVLALEIANVKLAKSDLKSDDDILKALTRIGVDSDTLAAVALGGLNATTVKTATEHGLITDERIYADFATRHKYLETALKLRGELRQDEGTGSGGLILIGMAEARKVSGHKVNCQCEECVAKWEERMGKGLRLSANRARALEGEILDDPPAASGVAAQAPDPQADDLEPQPEQ